MMTWKAAYSASGPYAEVRLRSFTTKVHKVDAMVAYKADDS